MQVSDRQQVVSAYGLSTPGRWLPSDTSRCTPESTASTSGYIGCPKARARHPGPVVVVEPAGPLGARTGDLRSTGSPAGVSGG